MKTIKIIIIILCLAILIAGAYVLYNRLAPMMENNQLATAPAATAPASPAEGETAGETEPPKMLAPDFTVYDLEGNAHMLSDFRGKPVIMNFWATWCGYCKMEMPDFQKKFDEYGEEIHFLMINATDTVRETVEKASGFIADEGYTFPVYYDVSMEAVNAYRVNAFPVTYFIDAEGYVVAQGSGALNAEVLQTGIDMLFE